MSEKEPDLVERLHREAVQRHWEAEEHGRQLLDQITRETLVKHAEERRRATELVERLHREAFERGRQDIPPMPEPPTLHYTQLPAASPESPLRREWETYRREVGRLLAEGHAGQHVLIKDEQILGIWNTHDEAMTAGYQRFHGQPFLVHQLQERERVLRCVNVHLWRNLRLPYRLAS
jgi:hypothetical protein